jgi:hypothetical protein
MSEMALNALLLCTNMMNAPPEKCEKSRSGFSSYAGHVFLM